MKQIEIRVENLDRKLFITQGMTLFEILNLVYSKSNCSNYVAAYVDNKLRDLSSQIFESKSIRFIPLDSTEGRRIYARTAIFLLQKAISDTLGSGVDFEVRHPIGTGYYIELGDSAPEITKELIDRILSRMVELRDADIAIVKQKMEFSEAIKLFEEQGRNDKVLLCKTRPHYWLTMYNLAGLYGYFYGALLHSTSMLRLFDIRSFGRGIALCLPDRNDIHSIGKIEESEKLYKVFELNRHWNEIIKIPTIGDLNQSIIEGKGGDIIRLSEALQEKIFSDLADIIYQRNRESAMRFVFVSGPSSSGKTTFAKRLSVQLSVLGLVPYRISLDDYFVDREQTPRDENGEYDYEALEAVDLEYFGNDLKRLVQGERVQLPKFDFKQGRKVASDNVLELDSKSILIIEGIHALNPRVSNSIARSDKYYIYASALAALSVDKTSVIHTTDNRLLRRIVRDNQFRGRDARTTIEQWMSVRRGEQRHIFPFQEEADYIFNTSLLYEFSILKHYAEPLLLSVPANCEAYADAKRLRQFLSYFVELPSDELPGNSLLREFIGGSHFRY